MPANDVSAEPTAPRAEERASLLDPANENHIRRARGHFWNLLGGEAANKVLRFVAAIILARFLAPNAFGIFNVGIAIAGVLVTASALGLPEIGSRTAASRQETARTLVTPVLVGRLAALAVVSAAFVVLARVGWPGHYSFSIAVIAVALAMTLTPDWLARGLERMSVVRQATTLGGVVACVGALAVAPTGSAELALVAFAAAEATVALICWRGIASMILPISMSLRELGSIVKTSWPLGVAAVVTYSYYANVDTILLASFRSASEAGVYSAAYRVFLTFNIVPIFAAYAAFPIFSRLAASHADAEVRMTLWSVLTQLACYGACVVGLVEVAGRPILHTLFGPAFAGASKTFTLLAVAAAWYAIGYCSGYSLIASGNLRGFVVGSLTAGVLSLTLDFLLIPPLGMIGAGVATAVAFVGATIIWLSQQQLDRSQAARLLSGLVAVSGGAGVVLVASGSGIGIGIATLTGGFAGLVLTIQRPDLNLGRLRRVS